MPSRSIMRARWTYRAHADPEIVCGQPARPACQQLIKNLPLARTESWESPDSVGDIGVVDRSEQGMIAVDLLKEVGCTGFYRANGRLTILAVLDPNEDDDKDAGPVAS
jgi:hypothetical protein